MKTGGSGFRAPRCHAGERFAFRAAEDQGGAEARHENRAALELGAPAREVPGAGEVELVVVDESHIELLRLEIPRTFAMRRSCSSGRSRPRTLLSGAALQMLEVFDHHARHAVREEHVPLHAGRTMSRVLLHPSMIAPNIGLASSECWKSGIRAIASRSILSQESPRVAMARSTSVSSSRGSSEPKVWSMQYGMPPLAWVVPFTSS